MNQKRPSCLAFSPLRDSRINFVNQSHSYHCNCNTCAKTHLWEEVLQGLWRSELVSGVDSCHSGELTVTLQRCTAYGSSLILPGHSQKCEWMPSEPGAACNNDNKFIWEVVPTPALLYQLSARTSNIWQGQPTPIHQYTHQQYWAHAVPYPVCLEKKLIALCSDTAGNSYLHFILWFNLAHFCWLQL
jgi:hypothetical protein